MQSDHLTIEELSAYVDEALDSRQREVAEVHLNHCADCQRELGELRETVARLRVVPNYSAPRSFRLSGQPSLAPVRVEPRAGRFHLIDPLWLRAFSGVAAALMVVAFASDFLGTLAPRSAVVPAPSQFVVPATPVDQPRPGAADQVVRGQLRSQPAATAPTSSVTGAGGAPSPLSAPSEGGGAPAPLSAPLAPGERGAADTPPSSAALSQTDAAESQALTPVSNQLPSGDLQRESPRSTGSSEGVATTISRSPATAPPAEPASSWVTPGRVTGLALGAIALILFVASLVAARVRRPA